MSLIKQLEYITKVDSMNTGGHCMVDFVHLRDGRVIGIDDESLVIYRSMDEYTNGDDCEHAYAFDVEPKYTMRFDKPITTSKEAKQFVVDLFTHGLLYHFDDDPRYVINGNTGRPLFKKADIENVTARVNEIFNFSFDPFEVAVALSK